MPNLNYEVISQNWITAWNNRDLDSLVALMAPGNNRFASLHAIFQPVLTNGHPITGEPYVRARFARDIAILNSNEMTFNHPYFRMVGDYFITHKFRSNTGLYFKETLSLTDEGLIDQVFREVDTLDLDPVN